MKRRIYTYLTQIILWEDKYKSLILKHELLKKESKKKRLVKIYFYQVLINLLFLSKPQYSPVLLLLFIFIFIFTIKICYYTKKMLLLTNKILSIKYYY